MGQNNTKGISALEQELACIKLILVFCVLSDDKKVMTTHYDIAIVIFDYLVGSVLNHQFQMMLLLLLIIGISC